MVSIEEAERVILDHILSLSTQEVPILDALGRIIAEDIVAPWDIPPADCSAMDGFAFCHDTVSSDCIHVCGFVPAGQTLGGGVRPGEAVRIMTGAPVPVGCDTVIPFENVEESGDAIRIVKDVKAGSHVRKRGENIRTGDLIIPAGTLLRPPEIGILASLGKTSALVCRRPEVAVLATGDELVDVGSVPGPGTIVNSNSYSIAAQVSEVGATPVMLGIARDDRESTTERILQGLASDCIVTTGGVSIGDKDFVKEVIGDLGGEIKFWKINMKPGKPFAFAILQGKPIFALPGNPVAAMVAFEQFVRPALLKMSGHSRILRPVVKATVSDGIRNKGDRPHFIISRVTLDNGRYSVCSTGEQNSGNLASMTAASGHIKLAPGEAVQPGDEVEVTLFDREFEMREPCHVADR